MGTRSNIGVRETDGTTTIIYCHWDGYPSHNGAILLDHHASEAAARAIIALGDLSSLGERTGPTAGESHTFDRPAPGVSVYYMRDRGETGCEARELAAGEHPCQEEYAYVWDVASGAWLWSDHGDAMRPLTLEDCTR